MPQGRKKQPFTGKQKREQLKERRARSRSNARLSDEEPGASTAAASEDGVKNVLTADSIAKINAQPDSSNRRDANRYALHFFRESDQELSMRKKEAGLPFTRVPVTGLQVETSECWPPPELGLPRRPAWHFSMTTQEVDMRENKSFREYLEKIEKRYGSLTSLSHFELNLETWRQLWRVTEMADIVLLVADIRHPVFHFPPALYDHVTRELKKDFVIVLNKADLIEAPLVLAWIDFFSRKYPAIHVVPFASYAGMKYKSAGKGKRLGNMKMASESCKRLYEVCHKIVGKKADISNWIEKINEELRTSEADSEEDGDPEPDTKHEVVKNDVSFYKAEKFKDGILTIGCVGHPNVGKSSVLNAIMGKKVVSVSRTPGHTKYFQTIFITPTVKLVDCPGLVFPSLIPKAMQVLMGCFPIAQLREPYSAIQYMAQRIDIPKILKLSHQDPDPDLRDGAEQQWSAYDVCEAWAIKRGFRTAKAARPDVYRAANHLLRMALDGRTLCLAFHPEGYVANMDEWVNHPHIKEIEQLQCQQQLDPDDDLHEISDSDHEEVGNAGDKQRSSRPVHKDKESRKRDEEENKSEEDEEEKEVKAIAKRVNKFALLADDE